MNLLLTKDEIEQNWPDDIMLITPTLTQEDIEKELLRCARIIARAQLKKVRCSVEYREKIARKFIVNCADCLHGQYLKDDCPHEDEDVCMWQRELADEILALLEE